jgi:hypothetical protein
MVTSRIWGLIVVAAAGLGAAASASAQRLELQASAGPTWRGVQSGGHGPSFDALTLEGGVARRVARGFKLRAAVGMTMGGASEVIAISASCIPFVGCGGGKLGTVVPGAMYHGRAGFAWTLPATGERLEARAGAGVHMGSVSGPDAVLGIDAGVSAVITPWLHVGLDATRLTSELGLLRWLVTPAIQLRLRSGGR